MAQSATQCFDEEEPRERLFNDGPGAVSDRDLLAILFGTTGKGAGIGRVADGLLSSAGGLKALLRTDPHALCTLPGMGRARASQLLCAMELARRSARSSDSRIRLYSAEDIYRRLAPTMAGLPREVFHVLCLSARNVLLREARIAEGTVDACPVDPREVFCTALSVRASAVVLAHNHPSGDPEPSALDYRLTTQLSQAGALVGIQVLDHLVVGDGVYVSLRQRGGLTEASHPAERRR